MDLLSRFKNKTIYSVHDSDLDGVTSRIVFMHLIDPIAKVVYLNTAQRDMSEVDISTMLSAEIVCFTDIAPNPELVKVLQENNKEFYIFDHHETSRSLLGELPNYFYYDDRCGAKILFDLLTEGKRQNRTLKQLVQLTNTYDLFEMDSLLWLDAKNLHNCMYSYVDWRFARNVPDTLKYIDFIRVQLEKIKENKKFYFTLYEQSGIQKANEKENQQYKVAIKNLNFRTDSLGIPYAYTECVSKVSFISNRILKEMEEKLDYIVIRGTFDKTSIKVSLRSNKIDVSKIAEKFGGGGHPSASGLVFATEEDFHNFKAGNTHLQ